MDIIHPSGESYDLPPDTALEITRSNPFFSDQGEQSVPLTLPLTTRNKCLLGFPHRLDNQHRVPASLDVIIREGVFQQCCRQAIFGADSTSVDTAFYLNTGEFYARLKEITINDVFGEVVWDYGAAWRAVNQLWRAYISQDHEEWAVFPVLVNDPNKQDAYKILNRIDFDSPSEGFDSYHPFYNRIDRVEIQGDTQIAIPVGYYMTPFLKCNWVLKQVFAHLGYRLNENFFSRTPEFRRLVFLNNTADAIITGKIHATDLLPSGNVNDLLDVFRKRFRCEFIPNKDKTVDIVLLEDVLQTSPIYDWSSRICASPKLTYHVARRIVLSQSRTRQVDRDCPTLSEVIRVVQNVVNYYTYPVDGLLYNHVSIEGSVVRAGLSGDKVVRTTVAASLDYVDNDLDAQIEAEDLALADPICIPVDYGGYTWPYLGDYRCVRSAVVIGDDSSAETSSAAMAYWLCFAQGDADGLVFDGIVRPATYKYGDLVATREINHSEPWSDPSYSLYLDGAVGIYKRFHTGYDAMLRNAATSVQYRLRLTASEKATISAYGLLRVDNRVLIPEQITYALGSGASEADCQMRDLTTRLPAPETLTCMERIPVTEYYWEVKADYGPKPVTSHFSYRDGIPVVDYFDPPTKAQYDAGGRYHQRTYDCLYGDSHTLNKYPFTLTVWLEPRKVLFLSQSD